MFGIKETFEYFGKKVLLGALFEVIDDPEDSSDYFDYRKAIDVWILPYKYQLQPNDMTVDFFSKQEGHYCVRNITKVTPKEFRQYGISTFEKSGFLHVIAKPSLEWERHYKTRIYEPLPIVTGKLYNFAVSVPPKTERKEKARKSLEKGFAI